MNLYRLEQSRDVIDALLRGEEVVLSFDDVDPLLAQRAIDIILGAAYALNCEELILCDLLVLTPPLQEVA